MVSINRMEMSFNAFFEELGTGLKEWVARRIDARLDAEVEAWLQRGWYERRQRMGRRQANCRCERCGQSEVRHFSRNGHRQRQLVTTAGVLTIGLPRVVCDCGGSVPIPFSILAPYERLWTDVVEQIGRWALLGLSLRQMQTEIGECLHTQVGLRKLNEVVADVAPPGEAVLSSVPPVVLLDGIWLTLFAPDGPRQADSLGRHRQGHQAEKACVLVALGLYPHTGHWGVLGWAIATSQEAWEGLLLSLERRGLYRERGLELFIHDGGTGLTAALTLMYPHIPHQRCLFHKLRNLWHAIRVPDALSRDDARAFKRDLLHQVQAVFYAASEAEAFRLRDAFRARLQSSQPDLVATLDRDWSQSVAFFRLHARFPTWPLTALRTTSRLERLNRRIRRLFRAAGAFHSVTGLLAALARLLNPLRLI